MDKEVSKPHYIGPIHKDRVSSRKMAKDKKLAKDSNLQECDRCWHSYPLVVLYWSHETIERIKNKALFDYLCLDCEAEDDE